MPIGSDDPAGAACRAAGRAGRRRASADAWVARDVSELGFAFPQLPHLALRLLAWLVATRRGRGNESRSRSTCAPRSGSTTRECRSRSGATPGNASLLSQFHGTSTLRELELLRDAGVPAADVLAAATRVGAEMLGIAADAGTVEPGKRADLVVLAADPLENMRAIRTIGWTVKNGIARTPEQWMQEP